MKKIILKTIIRNDIINLMEYNMEKYLKKVPNYMDFLVGL